VTPAACCARSRTVSDDDARRAAAHDRTALLASRQKDVADAAPVSRLDRVRLKDGPQVGIRLLELADREALTDLYGRLGEHSRPRRPRIFLRSSDATLRARVDAARLEPSRRGLGKLRGDTAAVTAMLDRLFHHAHVLTCGPRSWRTRVHSERNSS